MPAVEHILVGVSATMDEVGQATAAFPGALVHESGTTEIAARVAADVTSVDFEDDQGVALSQFGTLISIWSLDRHDLSTQEHTARALFDHLSGVSDWPLLLTRDAVTDVLASRLATAGA